MTAPAFQDARAGPRLRLSGITKAYPSVLANDGVDLGVMPGEIHAVLGENGAGKSTLMKIIYGLVQPDAGVMRWNEHQVTLANPGEARKLGIGMVFQNFSLFESLTVAENIALALDASHAGAGLGARIKALSARYGLPLLPDRPVHSMSVGERQRVEIVRCLLQDPQLLIMDEPTSVLTPQAVEALFMTLRRLAQAGCSILYVSHKLAEIRTLCDRATVLRAGKVTGTCDPREESLSSLARMMIGSETPQPRHRTAPPWRCAPSPPGGARALGAARRHVPDLCGTPLLRISGLSLPTTDPFGTALHDIDLEVHGGEIVGIAGVSGNGQRELLAALSGERRSIASMVVLNDEAVGHTDAGARRQCGLAFIPEERLGRGAVPELTLSENALLTAREAELVSHGLIDFERLRRETRKIIARFSVHGGDPEASASSLSGGNLQKFIVGREIAHQPKVLIAAQPTWGVDVGASAFIRQSLLDLRDTGAAILLISEDLEELFEIADRIAVIAQGRLSPPMLASTADAQAIGLLMSGSFIPQTLRLREALPPMHLE